MCLSLLTFVSSGFGTGTVPAHQSVRRLHFGNHSKLFHAGHSSLLTFCRRGNEPCLGVDRQNGLALAQFNNPLSIYQCHWIVLETAVSQTLWGSGTRSPLSLLIQTIAESLNDAFVHNIHTFHHNSAENTVDVCVNFLWIFCCALKHMQFNQKSHWF